MASIVSGALAGLSQAMSPRRSDSSRKGGAHSLFISNDLLPSTIKLQKELRGRRFRAIQAKLQEAVIALDSFKDEQWPPRDYVEEPDWMDDSAQEAQSHSSAQNDFDSSMTFGGETADTESTAGDFTEVSSAEENTTSLEESAALFDDNMSVMTQQAAKRQPTLEVLEDDPKTREPMHEAVISCLESYALILVHPSKTNKACEICMDCLVDLVDRKYVSARAGGCGEPDDGQSLMLQLLEAIAKCSDSSLESIQARIVKALRAVLTSPKCGIHEAALLLAVRASFHIYLVTKSLSCKENAKQALLDMLNNVFHRMEVVDAAIKSILQHQEKPQKPPPSQLHADSYVLFRSLCKLSSKALPGDDNDSNPSTFLTSPFMMASQTDPLALKNKILSLECILAVMEDAGEGFCNGEKFINLVQSQLCVSLLKNCMSHHTQVAYLSQRIFLILVYKFKVHLKTEIEVFLSNIFLKVLESKNSSFQQKALVLESMRSMCNDPVLLTQLFLNYDCDFNAMNLYNEIVFHLTKLSVKTTAQPTGNLSKKEAEQQFEIGLAAMEVLIAILRAFLKALDLPFDEENEIDDSAGKRIRSMLHLNSVITKPPKTSTTTPKNPDTLGMSSHHRGMMSKQPSLAQFLKENAASSDAAGKIVDAFDRKRNAEQNFELGAVKFTLSIKGGLKFFIENGFCNLDAKEIALFFLDNKDKLDKTQMGEVLGKEPDAAFVKTEGVDAESGGPGFYVRILHHYANALNFTGLLFDDAIRLFLSGFRLPGEAQKIDRIMEKFAEQYTRQNLDVFPSADTAFILAFSVIMLNTDLHNPSIKPERRMTVDSFLMNNRGIGENGTDLPADFLRGIFDRIKENPFSLKEDDAAREKAAEAQKVDGSLFDGGAGIFGASAEDRKREKFRKERDEMMAATEHLIRRKATRVKVSPVNMLTDFVNPADVVKPMFDVTWGPIIGILSQVLEISSNERSIDLCLNGFIYAIRISSHIKLPLARDTFVNSLAKFTFLGSIKEMKFKNIESVRTLLTIAIADGEYLGKSWGAVLQCISLLSRMRMSASGLDSDESFLDEEKVGKSSRKRQSSRSKNDVSKETEESNARAILESISELLIDKVFSSTASLSGQSLAQFIEQLVEVSRSEIAGGSKSVVTGVQSSAATPSSAEHQSSKHGEEGPRIFSLQRLTEVADYNMDSRPRLVWAKIWESMSKFYAEIGCHSNPMVSVFAIDSLRQLTFKFLEKPEQNEFKFQRMFLKPFLEIMSNEGTREDVRELVLQCVVNIVRARAHNLQSGWNVIFGILVVSARDASDKIKVLGLNILQRLLDEHLDKLFRSSDSDEKSVDTENLTASFAVLEKRNRSQDVEDFTDMCRASLAYVQLVESDSPRPISSSMRALCHTAIYADLLADERVLPPIAGAQWNDPTAHGYTYEGLSDEEALEMVLWRPLFEGLAEGIRCTAKNSAGGIGCLVQRGSVLAVRAILLRHGCIFTIEQLKAILQQTLLPSMMIAVKSDTSPVVSITSESPSVSSLDFLVDALPLPPVPDDEGLRKFEEECRGFRPLGPAELLLEASFTDMRHHGDGDLSRAYMFAKKDMNQSKDRQPFPDSWIATTAPIALGLLTDVMSEICLFHGAEGRMSLWPVIAGEIQRWCNGNPVAADDDNVPGWTPCEALVRIACREIQRIPTRLAVAVPYLEPEEGVEWVNLFCTFYNDTLGQNLDLEVMTKNRLLGAKPMNDKSSSDGGEEEKDKEGEDSVEPVDSPLNTPYGQGILLRKEEREQFFTDGDVANKTVVSVIDLDFGTLYSPETDISDGDTDIVNKASTEDEVQSDPLWMTLVPELKIRCIAAHCLQLCLFSFLDEFMPYLHQDVVARLMASLNRSREIAETAVGNEGLSHSFQQAMLDEWGAGEGIDEDELLNFSQLSSTRGSAMFFLTQTAGATNAVIRMLLVLYLDGPQEMNGEWDRQAYASPLLLDIMKEVLHKFVASEEKEGHLVDPNVWRTTNGGGSKVAIYCTSFALVVVGILKTMLSFESNDFEEHREEFFELSCKLISVQSQEIRNLVQKIMMEKFAPLLGFRS